MSQLAPPNTRVNPLTLAHVVERSMVTATVDTVGVVVPVIPENEDTLGPSAPTALLSAPVKVNDTVLPSVWIDTGDDFFVILPHELEKKNLALVNTFTVGQRFVVEQMVHFGGVDGSGTDAAKCVRLNEIQIGPYRYQKALSCFAPNDAFGSDGGLIGFDFLRHFNWTFDYPHGKLVLTPNGQ